MLTWRLAFRNLFRHKSRLALNLFLLIGAFTSIVLFKGFKIYVIDTVKDLMVDTQFGHIQIAKPSYWDRAPVERETDRMIANPEELIQKIQKVENVQSVSPRVAFFGLANTEDHSLPTRIIGVKPDVETKIQKTLFFTEGGAFTEPKQAILSSGLQKVLKIKIGDDITLVSPTLDGGLNAMDLQVKGIFKTGFAEYDKATVYISTQDAQKIFASEHVDNLTVFLKDPDNDLGAHNEISNLLQNTGLKTKPWTDLSDLYHQVEDFYNFQNVFIEFILLALLILSVSNTMIMTVFERLGEIGTLRAMGDQEREIQWMIASEAILLSILAIVIATPFSFFLMKFISSLDLPLVLPMSTRSIPVKMDAHLSAYIEASLICFFSVVLACLWPAKKSTKISIVTALRAKI